MEITCWGARGSIPVSGTEYIKFGGDTTCVEIRSDNNDIIILDAGSGLRRCGNRLAKESFNNINFIFTHSHSDHLLGFPFFKPLYQNDKILNIYGCPFAQEAIKRIFSDSLIPPFYPITYNDVKSELNFKGIPLENFNIGSIEIQSIPLSHPNTGFGYKFTENDKTFVFLTDNELDFVHPNGMEYKDYVEFAGNADLLFHDAEYSETEYQRTKTWGHTTYTRALDLATEAGVKSFGIFHHNQDRTDSQIEEIVEICNKILSDKQSGIDCFAVEAGQTIKL